MNSTLTAGAAVRGRTRVIALAFFLATILPLTPARGDDGVWSWLPLLEPGPTVYEPVGDRLLGFSGRTVWEKSPAATNDWTQVFPSGTGPTGNIDHAFYDAANHRVLVLESLQEANATVWAIQLSPSPAWAQIVSFGMPAAGRAVASAVYDAGRDRIVLYGGRSYPMWDWRQDVWAIEVGAVPTVYELFPAGPPAGPRREHAAIYDPSGDQMLVFGGSDGSSRLNDVWKLAFSPTLQWSEIAPIGTPPDPRSDPTAIHDVAGGRLTVFGGFVSGPGRMNDLWALDLTTWGWFEVLPTGDVPMTRLAATSAYDSFRERMVIVGGSSDLSLLSFHVDSWAIPLDAAPEWDKIGPQGDPPPGLRSPSSAYDATGGRMLVWGGSSGFGRNDETWALDLVGSPVWSMLETQGARPPVRREHQIIYDPVGNRMILFGGSSLTLGRLNDVWELALGATPPAWSQLLPSGIPPSGRSRTSMVYDPAGQRAIVFGGEDDNYTDLNDAWALDLSGGLAWSELLPSGSPPTARSGHTAVYDAAHDRMVMYGGGYPTTFNDVWTLDLSGTAAWTELSTTGSGPLRYWHSAIYDSQRQRMVIHGGGWADYDDTWALSLDGTPTWTELNPTGLEVWARGEHTAIYDAARDRMVVFGGIYYDYSSQVLDWSGTVSVASPRAARFGLGPAFPNPSHGHTSMQLVLPAPARVVASVYDVSGRRVRSLGSRHLTQGPHQLTWDGRNEEGVNTQPGLYFLRVRALGATASRKLLRVR